MSICDNCIHLKVCGHENVEDEAMTYCADKEERPNEFEWCKGCKEHDEENHCCHRLSNFIQTQAQEIHDMAYEEGKNDRPKGKWEITKSLLSYETIVRCSLCGDAFIGYQTEDYRYCPICGAKMIKGEEE